MQKYPLILSFSKKIIYKKNIEQSKKKKEWKKLQVSYQNLSSRDNIKYGLYSKRLFRKKTTIWRLKNLKLTTIF